DSEELTLRGAVLLKVSGVQENDDAPTSDEDALDDVRHSRPVDVFGELRRLLRDAGMRHAVTVLTFAGALVGMLTFLEGLLLRFLIDFSLVADPVLTTLLALVLLIPLGVAVLLDRGALGQAYSIGRRLDALLRVKLLERLPKMRESYFESRLVSDLAERGHAISQLKELPELLISAVVALTRLVAIGGGLILLAPESTVFVLLMMAVTLIAPLLLYPTVAEGDLRARSHLAALGRMNLDALRGAETIWCHGGGPAVELTHEGLLGDWRRSALSVQSTIAMGEMLVVGALTWLAAQLVAAQLASASLSVGSLLLLAYWALNLPLLATEIFETLRVAPQFRNIIGRVVELFGTDELEAPASQGKAFEGPVSLHFDQVGIARAESAVLHDITLEIPAGQRVAIVGPSGAGKSTLIDTLLGFQEVTDGTLEVDGQRVTAPALAGLRERTVC
ncbi:MAG: ABC transporter ATP-binding protein, partial [Pseudomonadota bacterium]